MFHFQTLQLTPEQIIAAAAIVFDLQQLQSEEGSERRALLHTIIEGQLPADLMRAYCGHPLEPFILPVIQHASVARARVLDEVRVVISSPVECAALLSSPIWTIAWERLYQKTILEFAQVEKAEAERQRQLALAKAEQEKKAAEEQAKKAEEAKKADEAAKKKQSQDAALAEIKRAQEQKNKEEQAQRASEQAKLKAALDKALKEKMSNERVPPLEVYAPIFKKYIENREWLKEFEAKRKNTSENPFGNSAPVAGRTGLEQMARAIRMEQPILLTQAFTLFEDSFTRKRFFPNWDDLAQKLFNEIERNPDDNLARKVMDEYDRNPDFVPSPSPKVSLANMIANYHIGEARRKARFDDMRNPAVAKIVKAHLGRAIFYLEKVLGWYHNDTRSQLGLAYHLLANCPLNYRDDVSTLTSVFKIEGELNKLTREANGDAAAAERSLLKRVGEIIQTKCAEYPFDLSTLPPLQEPALPPVAKIRADENSLRRFAAGLSTYIRGGTKTTLHLLAETCMDQTLFEDLLREEAKLIKEAEAKRKAEEDSGVVPTTIVPRSAFTMVNQHGLLAADVAVNEGVQNFLNSVCIPRENREIKYWFEGAAAKTNLDAKATAEQGAGVGVVRFPYQYALEARRETAIIAGHMLSVRTIAGQDELLGQSEPFLLAGADVSYVMHTFGVRYDLTSSSRGEKNTAKIFYKLLANALQLERTFNTTALEKLISDAIAKTAEVDMAALTKLVMDDCAGLFEFVITQSESGGQQVSMTLTQEIVTRLFNQAKKIAAGCVEKIIVTDNTMDGNAVLYFVVKPEYRNNPKVSRALADLFWPIGIAQAEETEFPAPAILMQTIQDKQLQALEVLLKQRRYQEVVASETLRDKEGCSILMQALPPYGSRVNQEMARLLIQAGASFMTAKSRHDSILSRVVRYDYQIVAPAVLVRLRVTLSPAAFTQALNEQMENALFSSVNMMRLLLRNGANPNTVLDFGWEWRSAPILLWTACLYGQKYNEMMSALIEEGADVCAVTSSRLTHSWWPRNVGIQERDNLLLIILHTLSYYSTYHSNGQLQQNVMFIERIQRLLAFPVGRTLANASAKQIVNDLNVLELKTLFENLERGVFPVSANAFAKRDHEISLKNQRMEEVLRRMDALDEKRFSETRWLKGPVAYGFPGKFHLDYKEMGELLEIFIDDEVQRQVSQNGQCVLVTEPAMTVQERRFYHFVRTLEGMAKQLATIEGLNNPAAYSSSTNQVIRDHAASLACVNVREVAVRITQLSSALGQLYGWTHVDEFMADQERYGRKGREIERSTGRAMRSAPAPSPALQTAAMGRTASAASASAAPVVAEVHTRNVAEEHWDHARTELVILEPAAAGGKLRVEQLRDNKYGQEAYYILSYVMHLALDANNHSVGFSDNELALCVMIQLAQERANLTRREQAQQLSFIERGAVILKITEGIVSTLINMNPAAFAKFRELQSRGVQWPHSPHVRRKIERAGFVFRPMMIKRDRCVCDACGVEVSAWKKYMQPWLLHDWSKRHPFAPPPGMLSTGAGAGATTATVAAATTAGGVATTAGGVATTAVAVPATGGTNGSSDVSMTPAAVAQDNRQRVGVQ